MSTPRNEKETNGNQKQKKKKGKKKSAGVCSKHIHPSNDHLSYKNRKKSA